MNSRVEITNNAVIKRFSCPEEYYAELAVYRLQLPMVPKLLEAAAPLWIKLQRIEGISYPDQDYLCDVPALAKTIGAFHAATLTHGKCLCHIDNQPGNILRTGTGYFLVDFADSRIDYPERDVTHLLLFWAADLPAARFEAYCTAFLHNYRKQVSLTNKLWVQCLEASITEFDTRRSLYGKPGGKNPPAIQAANRQWLYDAELTG